MPATASNGHATICWSGPLAQLVEQQTLNLRVRGSSPWRLTNSNQTREIAWRDSIGDPERSPEIAESALSQHRSTQGQRPAGTVLAGLGPDADAAEAAQGPDRRRPRPALRPPLFPRRRRGLAGSHRLPGGRRGEGPDAVRHGDRDADRCSRERAGRRGPRDAAGPRRGPAAGRPVEPAAARAARRGQGVYGRGAGGLRTARDADRHQPHPAQGCAMGTGGGARRRGRGL